jgi:hypothetical protein
VARRKKPLLHPLLLRHRLLLPLQPLLHLPLLLPTPLATLPRRLLTLLPTLPRPPLPSKPNTFTKSHLRVAFCFLGRWLTVFGQIIGWHLTWLASLILP